jgi:hypothetical protein
MGSLQVVRAEGTAAKTGIFFMLCSLSVGVLELGDRVGRQRGSRTAAGHDGTRVEVYGPAGDGGSSGRDIAARVVLVGAQLAQGGFESSQWPCWSRHGRVCV